jgi:AcrR family transcriptional regulator
MSRTRQDAGKARRADGGAHRRAPLPGAAAQEQLLDAATQLFYAEGVRAVGIDAVVERAGVNKMSLYRQFASKDDLVVAYLERMDAQYWERFNASLAKHPGDPARQVKQFFEDLARRASRPDYRGCPFVNVSCEFPDRAHPARQVVARNKVTLLARLTDLAREAGARDPAALGSSLALLVEGLYTASQTFDPPGPLLAAAPSLAAQLVDAALGDVGNAAATGPASQPCA